MTHVLKPDREEIARALEMVTEPGQVIELRLLKVVNGNGFARTVSGYFNDPQRLVAEAVKYAPTAEGAYITLNPVRPELLARAANRVRNVGKDSPLTSDTDIVKRRWLPIDIDPNRPRGISSTAEEHELSLQRARDIRDALNAEGWPRPILADSGNGAHLLYRIDSASDDQGMVQKCLEALALRFDDDKAKVDQSVFNPSRIWKLYGTLSRKGDSLPERPHRMARILELP
jgi:hypothetical protein